MESVASGLPGAPLRLELGRFQDGEPQLGNCEFAERWKVMFRSRELIVTSCLLIDGGYTIGRGTEVLSDTVVERIRAAYAQLQPAGDAECRSSATPLRLTVVSDGDPDTLQLVDADHAGCPPPGASGARFVEGLGPLYQLLSAELQTR
jgi:hypothetical protein